MYKVKLKVPKRIGQPDKVAPRKQSETEREQFVKNLQPSKYGYK